MNIKTISLSLKCCVIMDYLSGFLVIPEVRLILELGKAVFNGYLVTTWQLMKNHNSTQAKPLIHIISKMVDPGTIF